MKIFLDLDDVLVDFVGAAIELHGWTEERLREDYPVGTWEILPRMGLSLTQFWEPILDLGEDFWSMLPLLPTAIELVNLVDILDPGYQIVTSPGPCPTSYSGKVRWVRDYLPLFNYQERLHITSNKVVFASRNRLLIDDRPETVDLWRRRGGEGIIWPTWRNRLAKFADRPLSYVADQLVALRVMEKRDALEVQERERSLCSDGRRSGEREGIAKRV